MGYNALCVRRGLWLRVTMILATMSEHRGRRDNSEQDATQNKKPNISRDLTSHILGTDCNSYTTRVFECLLSLTGVFEKTMFAKCAKRDSSCLLSNTKGG